MKNKVKSRSFFTEQKIQELITLGYRRTSNKYRDIARIDCSDWKKKSGLGLKT